MEVDDVSCHGGQTARTRSTYMFGETLVYVVEILQYMVVVVVGMTGSPQAHRAYRLNRDTPRSISLNNIIRTNLGQLLSSCGL